MWFSFACLCVHTYVTTWLLLYDPETFSKLDYGCLHTTVHCKLTAQPSASVCLTHNTDFYLYLKLFNLSFVVTAED